MAGSNISPSKKSKKCNNCGAADATTAWQVDTEHNLSLASYFGNVYVKISLFSWESPNTLEEAGITDLQGSKLAVAHYNYGGSAPLESQYAEIGTAFSVGSAWYSTTPVHSSTINSQIARWRTSFIPSAVANISNTEDVTIATCQIDSYSSSDFDAATKLNASPQYYSMIIGATAMHWIPLYGCPGVEVGNTMSAGMVLKDAVNNVPLFSRENGSRKLYFEIRPDDSAMANLDYPREGQWCQINLGSNNNSALECYIAGAAITNKPTYNQVIGISGDEGNLFTTCGLNPSQSDKNKFNPWEGANLVNHKPSNYRVSEVGDPSKEKAFLYPGFPTLSLGTYSDCEEDCVSGGKKEFWQAEEVLMSTLSKLGFNCGFSNVKNFDGIYAVTQVQVDSNGVQQSLVQNKDIIYTTQVMSANYVEPICAIPMGATTRVAHDIEAKIDLTGDKTRHTFFKEAIVYAAVESTIARQWEYSKVLRGTIRRSFGGGSEENPVDSDVTGDGVSVKNVNGKMVVINAQGDILKESIEVLDASQVEIAVKDMMTHSSAIKAGVKIDDLLHMSAQLNYTMSEWTENNYFSSFNGQSASWKCTAQLDVAGFSKWASRRASTAIDDDGWTAWKDALSLSFDFGGGSVTRVKGSEFSMSLDQNGQPIINRTEEGDIIPKKIVDSENKSVDTLFELQSVNFNYNAEIFNGWNFSVTGPLLTQARTPSGEKGLKCHSPADWAYSLTGSPEDKIRWGLTLNNGVPQLALSAHQSLISDENRKAGGIRSKNLFGPGWKVKDVDCFLNVGATWNPDVGTFVPTADIKGAIKGIEYGINTMDGTSYMQRAFDWNFTDECGEWLDGTKGDTFEVEFFLRCDNPSLGQKKSPDGQIFNTGLDATFKKTVVEFGEVAGRLVLEANAWAKLQVGGSSGPVQGLRNAGFGMSASLTWKNNILEWFGLPFNLHPGISAGAVANFQFGGYTKQLSEGGNLVARKRFNDAMHTKISIGPISWGFEKADSFRTHMKLQHNSIFSIFGLGKCPILNKLGSREGIWQYVLRAGPIRAAEAVDEAALACARMRDQKFWQLYSQYKGKNLNIPKFATPSQIQSIETKPPASKGKPFPKCDEVIMAKGQPWTDSEGKAWPANKLCKEAEGDCQDLINKQMDRTWIQGNAWEKPFPCKMTKGQLVLFVNYKMATEFDDNFNKCLCIKKEFGKLTLYRDKVYGYDFDKWNDELDGDSTEEGVVKRALEIIDDMVLSWHLKGRDVTEDKKKFTADGDPSPSCNDCGICSDQKRADDELPHYQGDDCTYAKAFACALTKKLSDIITAIGVQPKQIQADDGSGLVNVDDPQSIMNDGWTSDGTTRFAGLCSTYHNASGWWKDQGICGSIYTVGSWIWGGAVWLGAGGKKLLGFLNPLNWLQGESSQHIKDVIEGMVWEEANPCKVTRKTSTGGIIKTSDICFKTWQEWSHYRRKYYGKLAFLDTYPSDSSKTGLHDALIFRLNVTANKHTPQSLYSTLHPAEVSKQGKGGKVKEVFNPMEALVNASVPFTCKSVQGEGYLSANLGLKHYRPGALPEDVLKLNDYLFIYLTLTSYNPSWNGYLSKTHWGTAVTQGADGPENASPTAELSNNQGTETDYINFEQMILSLKHGPHAGASYITSLQAVQDGYAILEGTVGRLPLYLEAIAEDNNGKSAELTGAGSNEDPFKGEKSPCDEYPYQCCLRGSKTTEDDAAFLSSTAETSGDYYDLGLGGRLREQVGTGDSTKYPPYVKNGTAISEAGGNYHYYFNQQKSTFQKAVKTAKNLGHDKLSVAGNPSNLKQAVIFLAKRVCDPTAWYHNSKRGGAHKNVLGIFWAQTGQWKNVYDKFEETLDKMRLYTTQGTLPGEGDADGKLNLFTQSDASTMITLFCELDTLIAGITSGQGPGNTLNTFETNAKTNLQNYSMTMKELFRMAWLNAILFKPFADVLGSTTNGEDIGNASMEVPGPVANSIDPTLDASKTHTMKVPVVGGIINNTAALNVDPIQPAGVAPTAQQVLTFRQKEIGNNQGKGGGSTSNGGTALINGSLVWKAMAFMDKDSRPEDGNIIVSDTTAFYFGKFLLQHLYPGDQGGELHQVLSGEKFPATFPPAAHASNKKLATLKWIFEGGDPLDINLCSALNGTDNLDKSWVKRWLVRYHSVIARDPYFNTLRNSLNNFQSQGWFNFKFEQAVENGYQGAYEQWLVEEYDWAYMGMPMFKDMDPRTSGIGDNLKDNEGVPHSSAIKRNMKFSSATATAVMYEAGNLKTKLKITCENLEYIFNLDPNNVLDFKKTGQHFFNLFDPSFMKGKMPANTYKPWEKNTQINQAPNAGQPQQFEPAIGAPVQGAKHATQIELGKKMNPESLVGGGGKDPNFQEPK